MSTNPEEFMIEGKLLSELRVIDLKESLEARGLSKSGSKQVLQKRLRDSLALERIQDEQSGKDPNSVPNMEMKSCGSNIVAQYLEKQQLALLAAKKAAQAARAGHSGDRCSSTSGGSTSVDDQSTAAATTTAMAAVVGVASTGDDDDGSDAAAVTATAADVVHTTTSAEQRLIEAKSTKDRKLYKSEEVYVEKVEERDEKIIAAEKPLPNSEQLTALKTEQSIVLDESPETSEFAAEFNQPQEGTIGEKSGLPSEQRRLSPVQPMDYRAENGQEKMDTAGAQEAQSSGSRSADEGAQSSAGESADENEDSEQVDYSRRTEEKQQAEESEGRDVAEEAARSAENVEANHVAERVRNAEDIDSLDHKDLPSVEEKPLKKRRWGSTTVGKRATVSISSDSLKEIVGHVKTTDTMLTSTIEEQVQLDYDEEPLPKRIVVSMGEMEEEDSATAATKEDVVPKKEEPKKLRLNRLSDPTLYDEGFIRERPPSPARRPMSNIIHVRCLTRPFTVKLLLEFLSKLGKVVKEDFWIDNIKSHCLVKYETQEDATNAREKLDNIRWPISNPNLLHVEFATEGDLERHRQKTAKENERPAGRATGATQNYVDVNKPKERTVREVVTNKVEERRRGDRSPRRDEKIDVNLWPKRREWDKGKEERNGRSPSPAAPLDKYGRKRLPSPPSKRPERSNEVAPVKLLEDLFRKTKATPCLYWLPLTQEQSAEKQKNRKKRALERAEKVRQLEEGERDRERENWRHQEMARMSYRELPKSDRNRRR